MKNLLFCLSALFATLTFGQSLSIKIYSLENDQLIGVIRAQDSPKGLVLTPNLHALTQGQHGFHIHEHPSCGNKGLDAGGHFDPRKTHHHRGPYQAGGHLGDLPALNVDPHGRATKPILAPHLRVSDLIGHSIMIHAGGDTYSDTPPLGGGGARVACGVIDAQK